MQLGVLRAKAKSLETKRKEAEAGGGGEEDEIEVPDLDIDRDQAMRLVREHERTLLFGRKPGRAPRIASNEEVLQALRKRVKALEARVKRGALRDGGSTGSPPPQDERER